MNSIRKAKTMQAFINLLNGSEYGVKVPYAGSYCAYVTPDDDRGGYHISYCNGMMPPHATDHAGNAERAAWILAKVVDLSRAREIEAE